MGKNVIFWDFDGTLVKPNQSFYEALTKASEEAGLSLSPQERLDFLQASCSWYLPQKDYTESCGEKWWSSLLAKLQELSTDYGLSVDKQQLLCLKFRFYAVHYPYELYPDTREVLKEVHSLGYDSYLLSNNFPELSFTVERLSLQNYFKGIFLSSLIGFEKPRKELFSYALQAAGNPENSIMIGDNPVADILGAKQAGLTAICVHKDAVCPDADFQCCTLSQIPEILKKNL